MAKKLKVYAGSFPVNMHAVVAAASVAEVADILRVSQYEVRNHWSVTGSEEDVAQALSEPGTVFVRWAHSLAGGWRRRQR